MEVEKTSNGKENVLYDGYLLKGIALLEGASAVVFWIGLDELKEAS